MYHLTVYRPLPTGLQEVHVFPSEVGDLTTDQFVAGIQRLRASYRTSCCHPKANITAVDRLGNVGTCSVDLGNVCKSGRERNVGLWNVSKLGKGEGC